MPELGQFLKEKREFSGLSLKKLSSVTGISDSELLKIENGTRKKPGWEHLCKIAKALNFHPFEILLNAGYISGPPAVSSRYFTLSAGVAMEKLRIDVRDRKSVV